LPSIAVNARKVAAFFQLQSLFTSCCLAGDITLHALEALRAKDQGWVSVVKLIAEEGTKQRLS
jgi:hypothetical protein